MAKGFFWTDGRKEPSTQAVRNTEKIRLNRLTTHGHYENGAGDNVCVLVGSVGANQWTDYTASPTCSNHQPRGIWSSLEARPNYVYSRCNSCAAGF